MTTKYKIDVWKNHIGSYKWLTAYYKTSWWPFWRECNPEDPLCTNLDKAKKHIEDHKKSTAKGSDRAKCAELHGIELPMYID